jgi:uncharacterized repeat protein (TIGR01451 family)
LGALSPRAWAAVADARQPADPAARSNDLSSDPSQADLTGYATLFDPESQILSALHRVSSSSGGQLSGCLEDEYGNTACNAGDVEITRLEVLQVIEGCDYAGDTATVVLRAVFDSTAAERYDVGFFAALDGGDAKTGSCYHDYLHPLSDTVPYSPTSGVGGYWNGEPSIPDDVCGDIEQAVDTYHDLPPVSILCVDNDDDGFAEISSCVTWDQDDNTTCEGVEDALPGTPSKCYCDEFTSNLVVPAGAITVTKTANPTTVDEPGEVVTYTVTVENGPGITVTIDSITDTRYGDIVAGTNISATTCAVPQELAPNAVYSCKFSAFVGGHAGTEHRNVVQVRGSDIGQNPVFDSDDARVGINDILPEFFLCKKAEPTDRDEPGGVFTFTLTFYNNSPRGEPVTLTQLLDDYRAVVDFSDCAQYEGTVLPGAQVYTCTYTHTLSAPGTYTNTAQGTVEDNEGNTEDDGCEAQVVVNDVQPTVDLVKTADPSYCPGADCTFTYTLEISNTSPVSVTITELADTQSSAAGVDFSECSGLVNGTLDPHTGASCTYTRTILSEGGTYTNTARVVVRDAQDNPARDSDGETVVVGLLPRVDLFKTVAPSSRREPGGVFTYTLIISNTSSQDAVTITQLADTNGPLVDFSDCAALEDTTLGVGESASCTYSRTLTVVGSYPNTATVTVGDEDEQRASDIAAAAAVINDVQPVVIMTKTVAPPFRDEPGGVFTYTIEVRNASPVTVEITSLTDTASGEADDFSECAGLVGTVLQAGEETSCRYTRILTAPGVYENTARVRVVDAQGNRAEDLVEEPAEVIDLLAFIEIIKVPRQSTVLEPGEDVTFDLTINNDSEVDTVTVIALTDSLFGDLDGQGTCSVPQEIPAGDSYQCTFTAFVPGDVGDQHINRVRVVGLDNLEQEVRDENDALILFERPEVPIGGLTRPMAPPQMVLPWMLVGALVVALGAASLVWRVSPGRRAG